MRLNFPHDCSWIVLWLLFICGHSLFSQDLKILDQLQSNPDSLARVNPNLMLSLSAELREEAVSRGLNLLEAQSYRYESKALYFLDRMEEAAYANLACAQTLINSLSNDHELTAECYLYSSFRYWDIGIFELTKELALKCLPHAHNANRKDLLAMAYDILGQVYYRQGNYERALVFYDSCFQIDEGLKDTVNMVADLCIIGRINTQLSNKEGIEILQNAIKMLGNDQESQTYSMAINAIGLGYSHMDDFDKAEKYITNSLSIAESLRDTHLIINRYINLGNLYTKFKMYDKAERYLLKSLNLMRTDFDANRLTLIYQNLGTVLQKKKKHDEAIEYFLEALTIAEKGKMLPRIRDIYLGLTEQFEDKKDYKTALKYHQKFVSVSDSIYASNARIHLEAMNFRYRSAIQESRDNRIQSEMMLQKEQLLRLKQQRLWLFCTVILLGISSVLLFHFFKMRKERQIRDQEDEIVKLTNKVAQVLQRDVTPLSMDNLNRHLKIALTEREYEVLALVTDGMSNREIAKQLYLSVNTIKFHLKNIYTKLDVKNRMEAVQKVRPMTYPLG